MPRVKTAAETKVTILDAPDGLRSISHERIVAAVEQFFQAKERAAGPKNVDEDRTDRPIETRLRAMEALLVAIGRYVLPTRLDPKRRIQQEADALLEMVDSMEARMRGAAVRGAPLIVDGTTAAELPPALAAVMQRNQEAGFDHELLAALIEMHHRIARLENAQRAATDDGR